MDIRKLLQRWETHYRAEPVTVPFNINLSLVQAARIKALSEMYVGRTEQQIITDLLEVALEQLEEALPYVQGDKVVAEDEFGDPLYADEGPTPRLLELTRKHLKQLQARYQAESPSPAAN